MAVENTTGEGNGIEEIEENCEEPFTKRGNVKIEGEVNAQDMVTFEDRVIKYFKENPDSTLGDLSEKFNEPKGDISDIFKPEGIREYRKRVARELIKREDYGIQDIAEEVDRAESTVRKYLGVDDTDVVYSEELGDIFRKTEVVYVCDCDEWFDNSNAYNGHKKHCDKGFKVIPYDKLHEYVSDIDEDDIEVPESLSEDDEKTDDSQDEEIEESSKNQKISQEGEEKAESEKSDGYEHLPDIDNKEKLLEVLDDMMRRLKRNEQVVQVMQDLIEENNESKQPNEESSQSDMDIADALEVLKEYDAEVTFNF